MNSLIKILIGISLYTHSIEAIGQTSPKLHRVLTTKGLVAVWDFKEEAGQSRKSMGKDSFSLKEMNGPLVRMNEGPLSGFSAKFDGKTYLSLPHSETGALNIFGEKQGITVVAWVKWTGEQTGFVGGMWNEYQDGGKRHTDFSFHFLTTMAKTRFAVISL